MLIASSMRYEGARKCLNRNRRGAAVRPRATEWIMTKLWAFGLLLLISASLLEKQARAFVAGQAIWWGDLSSLTGSIRPPDEFTNVTAVTRHLALWADGVLFAWGNNAFGEVPIPAEATNIVAIAEGYGHRLALRQDGIVVAWGAGKTNTGDWLTCSYGQSMVPAGLSNVVSIAAGSRHSLALRADGTIVGWGFNYYGETNVPPGLSNVVAIASNPDADFNLALRADGTVAAWGYNYHGETNVPAGLTNVVSVAAGAYHSLAVTRDGGIVAWGDNYDGQTNVPAGLGPVKAVAAGRVHSLALTGDGRVVAWGLNDCGQSNVPFGLVHATSVGADGELSWALNDGSVALRQPPQSAFTYSGFPMMFTVEAVGAPPLTYHWSFGGIDIPGATGSCLSVRFADPTNAGNYSVTVSNPVGTCLSPPAVLSVSNSPPVITRQPASMTVGAGWEWVYFDYRFSGSYPMQFQWRLNGVEIPGATGASLWFTNVSLADAGWYDVIISNRFGAVTSSVVTLTVLPSAIRLWGDSGNGLRKVVPGLGDKLAIAAGLRHCLALERDRTVSSWGANESGQTNVPAALSNVIAIAGGWYHSLALKQDGSVAAWGGNEAGQCQVPVGLTNAVAIAAGGRFSMALKSDGSVAVWGAAPPVPSSLSNVVAIAAGAGHCLALRQDGTVVGWGYGPAAAVPSGLSRVAAIAAGYSHSLALLDDGTVVAWGTSYQGMGVPVTPPTDLSNVVAIAAGGAYFGDHSLALKRDGTVVGWGDNASGQIDVPAGMTNVSAVAAGANFSLALQGTNPPSLHARISDLHRSVNSFSLMLPTWCGRVYELEYRDSLEPTDWRSLQLAAGNGRTLIFLDLSATNVQRFYRVRQW